ncbi:MAG TPA: NUDIX domain-containing protein [Chloroflexota bacterium]
MTEVTRHFTATTFVVHGGKVLLHRHPKQGLWLPPGGHIERDEFPHVAAVREIEEETGLRVRLHSEELAEALSREMECAVVPQPAFILVEDINAFHQHIDLTYFARLSHDWLDTTRTEDAWRANGFEWFAPDDLDFPNVPQNVKVGARRAVDYFEMRSEPADTMTGETSGV